MEKDVDKITHKVGKQVKKIRKSDDVEKGVIALANRVGRVLNFHLTRWLNTVCQVLLYYCSVDYYCYFPPRSIS